MKHYLVVFAGVFISVFMASMAGQFTGQLIFDDTESPKLAESKSVRTVAQMPLEQSNNTKSAPLASNGIDVPVKSPQKKDLCASVSCTSSKVICPDGFVDKCKNYCEPSTGVCADCTPECKGHLIQAGPSSAGSAVPSNPSSPSQQPVSSVSGSAKITAVNYDADGDDRKKESWNGEWVVIEGNGDLSGWTLSDGADHVFAFPQGFVLSGSVRVYSGDGQNTGSEVYWNSGKRPIWNNDGDTAFLKDASGTVIDKFSY